MSEWKECKLGDVAEIKGGKRLPLGCSLTDLKTAHPYIRTRDINNHKIAINELLFVPDKVFPTIKRYTVEKGDIILSIVGTIGLCAIIPEKLHLASLTENCAKIVNIEHNILDKIFIYYYLIGPDGQDEIFSRNVGSTQPKLPLYNIKDIPILLPPLPEQKAIAGVLSSLDDKIDLLHRQNKTLEAMAETLFRQWFVEPCKDGLPEGWEEGKLPDEFAFTMGQSPVGTSFNEDKIGTPMFQGNADFGFRFPSERVYTTEPTRFAEPLDTLVSVRAPVGEQNMALVKCCIGRGVASFRYSADKDYYTYTYFKIRSLMTEIKKFNEEGTVFGSIGKADFEALDITIPPKSLIQDFEKTAKPINEKVIENCAQIQTLEKLRDTLLPKLMSGEVRVKV